MGEAVHTDVDTLAAVMKENDGLSEVLVNPLVPSKKKTSLINKIAAEASFNQFSTNFLNLLVDKGRIDCIVEVVEAFEELYCEVCGSSRRRAAVSHCEEDPGAYTIQVNQNQTHCGRRSYWRFCG